MQEEKLLIFWIKFGPLCWVLLIIWVNFLCELKLLLHNLHMWVWVWHSFINVWCNHCYF